MSRKRTAIGSSGRCPLFRKGHFFAENGKVLNAVGLIKGRTDTTIVPTGTATRAEAATMVQRFCENVLAK